MSRYERGGRYTAADDILDLLRVDAGQRTIAELVGERALAAAEIAKLRTQVESLTRGVVGADRPGPRVRERPLAAGTAAGHSQQKMESKRIDAFPSNALLRLTDVCRLVGLSRTTIYNRVSDSTFPRPLRISDRCVRWRMQDLLEWTAGLRK